MMTASKQQQEIEQEQVRQEVLTWLNKEYNEVLKSGNIAPEGCWIEIAKCHNRKGLFQVFYRSNQAIFDGKKRKYIGMRNSPKHHQAITAIDRRDYLHSLSIQIKEIQNV
ncbi:hypothetical protein [Synechococcus sp. PCC 6312]|uniref:hypothetical protein n=1 Tax=Synechococcus sp. (strain ATCC 27167 / PCC 6312) TaxID=195253 RepID=UPI0012EAF61A|nr:hypothetical protein [Synechococcus sp. PCC 6312]